MMTEILKTNYKKGRNVDMTLHVCRTGEKEQFYTLYVEGVAWGEFGASYWCNYVQNLSHNKKDAEQKARDYAERRNLHDVCHHLNLEIHDSPRPIYIRHEAFGVEMKMSKKRTMWYGEANSAFWDEWKKNKQGIKDAGYWVKKTDGGQWMLFKRVENHEKEYDTEEE